MVLEKLSILRRELMSFERSDVIYMFFSLLTLAPNRKVRVTCCGLFDYHVTFFKQVKLDPFLWKQLPDCLAEQVAYFFVS